VCSTIVHTRCSLIPTVFSLCGDEQLLPGHLPHELLDRAERFAWSQLLLDGFGRGLATEDLQRVQDLLLRLRLGAVGRIAQDHPGAGVGNKLHRQAIYCDGVDSPCETTGGMAALAMV
jgi:hypothetical protein